MSAPTSAAKSPNPAGSRNKKNKKKNKAATPKADGEEVAQDINAGDDGEGIDGEGTAADDLEAVDTEQPSSQPSGSSKPVGEPSNGINHAPEDGVGTNGLAIRGIDSKAAIAPVSSDGTAEERMDALVRERDELKAEVTQLRQSLETIAGQHDEDASSLREELVVARAEKDNAEAQYENLLGRIGLLRQTVAEKLEANAAEMTRVRGEMEELEEQNQQLRQAQDDINVALAQARAENKQYTQELEELRNRSTTSQTNWSKERDELTARETRQREKFEEARQAMQDWEVLASEERSQREHLADRIGEFEEQILNHKEALERTTKERDEQNQTVDGLQRALQEIQEARKKELRELVETSQSQLEDLKRQLSAAEEKATSVQTDLDETKKELERAAPFEEQVREKNLAIGKLRHEAVTTKEHLTKALRFLKQRKPEDTVDRQLVTNHVLHFIALDRADPKKFQVLQLIAALLAWTDEQKEQAGLARPGAVPMSGSLRLPQAPFRRTPSSPSLGTDPMAMDVPSSAKESLAELWSDFLEREAEEGRVGPPSRKSSATTVPTRAEFSKSPPPTGLGVQ